MRPNADDPIPAVLEKVTAFVTRETTSGRDLLYFRHPVAGVQLPAGTVEAGEMPEIAVRREVEEETGLTNISIAAYLGCIAQPLADDERAILVDSPLGSMPGVDATLLHTLIKRGNVVKVIETVGDFVRVAYQTVVSREGVPTPIHRKGWLHTSVLTDQRRRHLYHVRVVGATQEAWTVQADNDFLFSLFWSPIDADAGLHESQVGWLRFARANGL